MGKKKQIKTISLHRLHNNQWFEFMDRMWASVRELGAETLKIVPYWELFAPLYNEAKNILKPIEKSVYTADLVELDKKRDAIYADFKKTVHALVRNFDANKANAAKRVVILFDAYENVTGEDYLAETSDITNVVQDLTEKYQAELTTMGLNEWKIELDKANKNFINLWTQRAEEQGAATLPRGIEPVREDLDWIYTLIIWQFEGNLVVSPDENLKEFVNKWNKIVQKFKNLIAVREGKKDEEINEVEEEN